MLKAGMRVIAGQFRSRLLTAPRGGSTRPTSDRLRETLFNVIGPKIQGAHFADLYAGSGAVGIEALSRGAAHCWLVELGPPAMKAIRKNLADLGIATGVTVEVNTVQKALKSTQKHPFDVLFLDPPYDAGAEYAATLSLLAEQHDRLLAPASMVIAEHASRTPLAERYGSLVRTRVLKQGDASLSFYAIRDETAS